MLGATVLGRYRITHKLGEGTMGQVYRAEQRVGDAVTPVAIKVLAAVRGNDEYIVERFRREAGTLATLHHPNIVRFHEYGEEGGRFLSVMEFVPGESLGALLRRGPVPYDRAMQLAAQLCAGLDAAHQLGIVHRDLKPDNVLLVPAEPVPTVKIVDFGIARRPVQPGERPLTNFGTVLGTPAFMCPEQLRGEPVDARADVYALGLLVYMLFTGGMPWPAHSLAEWTDAHLNVIPTPLRMQRGCEALPEHVERAVQHALEKSAARRTPTALQLLAELRGEAPVPEAVPETLPPPPEPPRAPMAPAPPTPFVAPAPVDARSSRTARSRRIAAGVVAASAIALGASFFAVRTVLARHETSHAGAPSAAHPVATQPSMRPLPPPPQQPSRPALVLADPVALRSMQARSAARDAVRDGLARIAAHDLDGGIEALARARSGSALRDEEIAPLRSAVDRAGAAEIRRRVHAGRCDEARELSTRLLAVGAALTSRDTMDHGPCRVVGTASHGTGR